MIFQKLKQTRHNILFNLFSSFRNGGPHLLPEDGRTPLFIAAESNHPVVAQLLLEAGAEKERATEDGRTPLLLGRQWGGVMYEVLKVCVCFLLL